ncbi:MAG: 16S rRNA (guanine(527)-N(7))-methyltransferase RsmG [Spirochaetaceae bacterium]|jgi:16S rRNA (guanine527-N7)-methyltransferase|nr:16S rRNA (guanine(527)-N(7))-methyltransferase RsmG [Spirochaetaceae bacterium]
MQKPDNRRLYVVAVDHLSLLVRGLAELYPAGTHPLLPEPRFREKAEQLAAFIREIERFNGLYGLVKAADRRELVIRHILDSLAPLEYIAGFLAASANSGKAPELADAGSGAGLPGIPLAICLSGVHCTLIERMTRRADFLRNTLAVLGLSNVTVEEGEIKRAPPGRFTLLSFRALTPLEPGMLKDLFRLLAPGGRLAAYKGRRKKTEEEIAAAGLRRESWELIPLKAPFLEEERNLAVLSP